MRATDHHQTRTDLVGIVREASLYDWLVRLTRQGRRPEPVPGQLHADLGLPSHPCQSRAIGWHGLG